MRNITDMNNRLTAVLLSTAMMLSPILQSMPVYAAEPGTGMEAAIEAGIEAEDIGTLPDAGADKAVSDEEAPDEAAGLGTQDGEPVLLEYTPMLAGMAVPLAASDFSNVGGWNESIYAEIAGVKDADVTAVSYSGTMNGSLTGEHLEYLVRDNGNGGVRIDIPGLKAGTYTLSVTVGGQTLKKEGITVYAYDRSGFAHFNYTGGVGAYKDDGTLKENAVVLYVTDANKNDVVVTCGGITVKGIGNILNSVGQESSGGKTSGGGKANTNQGIIKALAKANKPLVVRFIGCVSETGLYKSGTYDANTTSLINGLTAYSSADYGGTKGDNGHMARIQSGKDITLEGIGYDATIDGWGFHYIAEGSNPEYGKSFEVRNLTFINTPEDAIGMEGQQSAKNTSAEISSSVEHCWIHHNEFYRPNIESPAESDKSEGDGSVDFKRGQYFTCSYNYFEGCHKTNLVGSADYSLQFNLTYHHNYWYLCKARGPLARNANIHMYNNVWEQQTDYAQNTRANAYIFSEYNLFYACKSPQAVEDGAIKSYHDSISSVIWNKGSAGTVVADKAQIVPNNCQYQKGGVKYDKFDTDPELSYIPGNNYQLETDFTELRKVIVSQTGTQDQKPKLAKDVTASEYSVVPLQDAADNEIDIAQSKTLAPGKISKSVYAFSVGGTFNLSVSYTGAPGVLVNEAGENLLTGDGSVEALPAGCYMIQAENFQPGNALKDTVAVFKDITISSLKIEATDPGKHIHKWVLDSQKCKNPTCTETGINFYTCTGTIGTCDQPTKQETVAALGHSYGSWIIDTPATEEQAGEKSRSCTRCGSKETAEIPAGSSGTGGGTGGAGGDQSITAPGDHILTFEGLKENDESDFFTVTGSYSNSKGSTTVNDVKYEDCLKMESKTSIKFSCNDGATLFMAFASTEFGKTVKVDGKTCTTGSDGTVTVDDLAGGSHEITKGDTINLFYLSVSNGGTAEEIYTISFDYNYDDAPDAKTVRVLEYTSYASMAQLVPVSFTRSGYTLSGLYTDASCTQKVNYPYVVSGNATLYADWLPNDTEIETNYLLIFNTGGGSAVASVQVSSKEIYEITQRSARAGYAFTGWYDAPEGGNYIDKIDGSRLNGNFTVYAHWNAAETVKNELDASKDFSGLLDANGNITGKMTVGGFTIHALSGGVGEAGKENPKYYMTVKADANNSNAMGLYTNGVLLTDKSIAGNEDGLLKTLEFTTEGAGILTVDLALTASPDSSKKYDLVLADKPADGPLAEVGRVSLISAGKKRTTKTFEVKKAGTYYLYAEGEKGVVYYKLKFVEQQFTILYQIGNGTMDAALEGGIVKAGDVITLPDCTPPAGYLFKGWSADDRATVMTGSYTVSEEDSLDGVITIEAVYEAIPYTLKYDANGGTLPAGTEASVTVTAGQKLTLGSCTPADGKKFMGWSIGSSEELITALYTVNPADADGTKTITLKAVYADEEDQTVYYTVTLNTDGGTLADGGGAERLIAENQTIDPGTCEKPGYVFKGWSVDGEIVEMPYTVTENVTLKAIYGVEQKYTIRYQIGNGTTDAALESVSVKEGDVITLPVCTPPAWYLFKGWSADGGTTVKTDSYTVNGEDSVNGQITIKAVYEAISYTLKYDANGGTLPAGTEASVTVTAGQELTLGSCTPAAGQKFMGWSIGSSEELITTLYTVNPEDADENNTITLKAVYEAEGDQTVYYTVTLDTDGGTLVGGGGTERLIAENQTIDPGACEKPGYVFKGWSVNGEDVETPYTVTQNVTLKAIYVVEQQYTIQYQIGNGTTEAPLESVSVKEGDVITLPVCTPPAGYLFKGWSIDGSEGVITASYTVNPADADENKTITLKAVYEAEGDQTVYYTVTLDTDGGTLVVGGGTERQVAENQTIDPGACEKPGYVFKGWSVDGEVVKTPYTVTKNVTLKAVYGPGDSTTSHEGIYIVGLKGSYEYTGAKIIPNIGVVDYDIGDGRLLTPKVDYTVTYKNNNKIGEATVIVTGKGNYAGKDLKKTFKIEGVNKVTEDLFNLKSAKLAKINPVTYTGEDQHPNFTLTLKNESAVEYSYDKDAGVYKAADGTAIRANVALSNNVNKGTATILITGAQDSKGNATKLKKTFKITAVDLAKAAAENKIQVQTQPGIYAVKGAAPASITVTCNGQKLKNGTDYTVKYTANKNATGDSATAKITITGKGNYAKKYTAATYAIKQLDLSGLEVKAVKAYTGLKAGKVTATVLDKDGTALKSSQYTLHVYQADGTTEYNASDKLEAGRIYVEAVAKDTTNLTGQTTKAEIAVGVNIASAKITLSKGTNNKTITKTYTGEALELGAGDLTVTIKEKDENNQKVTKTLIKGTDYEIVSYTNNVKKGTATAVIMGVGKYSGTKTVKFKIVGKPMQIKGETTWTDASSVITSFMQELLR